MKVYHFTDTSRLPWILQSGELRPGGNKAGGYPDPEFVWATMTPLGDLTASLARGTSYRSGKVRHVRFTIDSEKFMRWQEVPKRFPQWTKDHVQRIEATAQGASNPSTWWCSVEPIKLADVLAIDSRSYMNNSWSPFDPETEVARMGDQAGMTWLGVEVAGAAFVSARITAPDGRTGYAVR